MINTFSDIIHSHILFDIADKINNDIKASRKRKWTDDIVLAKLIKLSFFCSKYFQEDITHILKKTQPKALSNALGVPISQLEILIRHCSGVFPTFFRHFSGDLSTRQLINNQEKKGINKIITLTSYPRELAKNNPQEKPMLSTTNIHLLATEAASKIYDLILSSLSSLSSLKEEKILKKVPLSAKNQSNIKKTEKEKKEDKEFHAEFDNLCDFDKNIYRSTAISLLKFEHWRKKSIFRNEAEKFEQIAKEELIQEKTKELYLEFKAREKEAVRLIMQEKTYTREQNIPKYLINEYVQKLQFKTD